MLLVCFIGLFAYNSMFISLRNLYMMVSNLMENAIQACGKLSQNQAIYLLFTCQSVGQLLLEMKTPMLRAAFLMKAAILLLAKKNTASAAKASLPLQKKVYWQVCCIKARMVLFGSECWCEKIKAVL